MKPATIKPSKSFGLLEAYSPPTEGRAGKTRLDFNENTVGCSEKVLKAIRQSLTPEFLSAYPEYSLFRKKLAAFLGLSQDQVLQTNGGDEAIRLVMDVFLNPGQEVIIPVPTFAMFKFYATLAGAEVKEIPLNLDFSFPIDSILSSITPSTKLIVLVNPNNPTGTSIPKNGIIRILEKAEKCSALVLLDEAYSQFSGTDCLDLIGDFGNLVIIRTFSKIAGLAGLRIGYIASCRELVAILSKAQSPYSVNSVAVAAAIAAMKDLESIDSYVAMIARNKQKTAQELAGLGIKVYASSSNFLLADFGLRSKVISDLLAKKGILVRDMGNYPLLAGCIRITIGTDKECLLLLDSLTKILSREVLLFDMDGTLVDASSSYGRALSETVGFFSGRPAMVSDIQKLKETGNYNNDWDCAESLLSKNGLAVSRGAIISKFQQLYSAYSCSETWLPDEELLNFLYSKYWLGIVTGRPRVEAESALAKFGVSAFFPVVVCMEDLAPGKSKPDPAGILLALSKLAKKPKKDYFYIGDGLEDIKAASSSGIGSIGVITPGLSARGKKILKSKMLEAGAKEVLESVNDLKGAVP